MVLKIKLALHLRDQHVLMWQSLGTLNVFNTLTLKYVSEKREKLEYRFVVESTKIEITTFPYKSALSKANVKINKIVSTK